MAVLREFNISNGHSSGNGPSSYQVDHIVPLCLGGPDCGCNMQYLTYEEHLEKNSRDLSACATFKVKP